MSWTAILAGLALGYALGSIPFGLLLTRGAGLGDIRAIGSGNIGATNVLRTGNKALAAGTLLLDALKGTAAVLLAGWLFGAEAALAAALGAILGHCFPAWLSFRGGKGVATYLGVVVALDWRAGLAFVLAWIAVAAASRYSSLAALTASLAPPLVLLWLGIQASAVVLALIIAIVWLKHRENIVRLASGRESRIGSKG